MKLLDTYSNSYEGFSNGALPDGLDDVLAKVEKFFLPGVIIFRNDIHPGEKSVQFGGETDEDGECVYPTGICLGIFQLEEGEEQPGFDTTTNELNAAGKQAQELLRQAMK